MAAQYLTYEFVNKIHNLEIANGHILVSYDVSSQFANVPFDETIEFLTNSAIGLKQRMT